MVRNYGITAGFKSKRYVFAFAAFIIFAACIAGLPSCVKTGAGDSGGKLQITATLFPQYDFARQIAGDKADIKLLLPPGTESHGFDPKPGDMLDVYNSDLFIYTGENMEPWAETIIKGAENENITVVNCAENIELLHDDSGDEHGHEHGDDPHIWLDPTLAAKIVDAITAALCEIDAENSEFYRQNADDYKKLLQKLDESIFEVIKNAKRNTIVFGGRFSYIYFLRHFGLEYVTAYDSCSVNAEPSVSEIAYVISFIKQNGIPCIYYEELSDPKVARSIAEETNTEYLLFSTAHNITKSEFDGGTTFLDIMYANLENIKKGLN